MKRLTKNLLLVACLALLPFSTGCETTDYEPLIMKKKLRELESEVSELREQIEELKSNGVAPGSTGTNAAAQPNGSDNAGTPDVKPVAVTTKPEDETALREKLENAGAFFLFDDDGYVIEADLLECSDPTAVNELPNFPKLEKVILNGTKVTPKTFDALSQISRLNYLDIERSVLEPNALAKLKGLKDLKFLQLFKATISEDAMKVLSEFPALEQIRCGQTRVGDDELKHLQNLKTLKAIDLSDCNRVTIAGLESLADCPKLSFLKVWGKSIDDECMKVVGKMKSLRVLGLNDTAVSDDGIAHLAKLNLSEVHLFRTVVGDKGIEVLSKMPGMAHLNLRDTKISDDAIKQLANLENLKKLDLSECNSPGITNEAGRYFAKMTNLTNLNLWSTKFSDEGVKDLVGLKNLTWLNLDNTKVTDKGVKMLEKLPQLSWIHLGKTEITDDAVESLMTLENLRYINISHTAVTEDAFFDLDDHFAPKGCQVVQP